MIRRVDRHNMEQWVETRVGGSAAVRHAEDAQESWS